MDDSSSNRRIWFGAVVAFLALFVVASAVTIPRAHRRLTDESLELLAESKGRPTEGSKQELLSVLTADGITNLTVSGHRATVYGAPRDAAEVAEIKSVVKHWGIAKVDYVVDGSALVRTGTVDVTAAVSAGSIILRGVVPTQAHRKALVDAAGATFGAGRVGDQLTVSGLSTGSARTDDHIAGLAAAIGSLGKATTAEATLKAELLKVTATVPDNGTKGTIDSAVAAAVARGLTGSAAVTVATATAITAAPTTAAVTPTTVPTTGSVAATATVANGVITLRGTVLSAAHRKTLVDAATAAFGAGKVVDQLTVSGLAPKLARADDHVAGLAAAFAPLAKATSGEATLTDDQLKITATVPDAASKTALDGVVGAASGRGLTGTGAVVAPQLTLAQQADALQRELDAITAVQREIVFFATGDATLSPEAIATLERAVAAFKKYPLPAVEIGGHTDSIGDPASNQALSEARAAAVRDHLVAAGIAPERLTSIGYGQSQPAADNATAEGRAANRRVAFVVKKG